jgi:Cu/Ag efflux protein CusF
MKPSLKLFRLVAAFLAVFLNWAASHEASAASTGASESAPLVLAQQSEPTGLFHGDGLVLAVDARTGALTLKHSDIPGFMPAMEMMFRVNPPSLSDGLRKGDRIEFTLEGPGGIIRDVKLIRRAE